MVNNSRVDKNNSDLKFEKFCSICVYMCVHVCCVDNTLKRSLSPFPPLLYRDEFLPSSVHYLSPHKNFEVSTVISYILQKKKLTYSAVILTHSGKFRMLNEVTVLNRLFQSESQNNIMMKGVVYGIPPTVTKPRLQFTESIFLQYVMPITSYSSNDVSIENML